MDSNCDGTSGCEQGLLVCVGLSLCPVLQVQGRRNYSGRTWPAFQLYLRPVHHEPHSIGFAGATRLYSGELWFFVFLVVEQQINDCRLQPRVSLHSCHGPRTRWRDNWHMHTHKHTDTHIHLWKYDLKKRGFPLADCSWEHLHGYVNKWQIYWTKLYWCIYFSTICTINHCQVLSLSLPLSLSLAYYIYIYICMCT